MSKPTNKEKRQLLQESIRRLVFEQMKLEEKAEDHHEKVSSGSPVLRSFHKKKAALYTAKASDVKHRINNYKWQIGRIDSGEAGLS